MGRSQCVLWDRTGSGNKRGGRQATRLARQKMPNLSKQAPEACFRALREGCGEAIYVTVRAFHVVVLALETPRGVVRLNQVRICHEEPSVQKFTVANLSFTAF